LTAYVNDWIQLTTKSSIANYISDSFLSKSDSNKSHEFIHSGYISIFLCRYFILYIVVTELYFTSVTDDSYGAIYVSTKNSFRTYACTLINGTNTVTANDSQTLYWKSVCLSQIIVRKYWCEECIKSENEVFLSLKNSLIGQNSMTTKIVLIYSLHNFIDFIWLLRL
jgi:hypothetical protein